MVVLNKAFCYTLQQLLYLHSMPSVEILKGSFHFFFKMHYLPHTGISYKDGNTKTTNKKSLYIIEI